MSKTREQLVIANTRAMMIQPKLEQLYEWMKADFPRAAQLVNEAKDALTYEKEDIVSQLRSLKQR